MNTWKYETTNDYFEFLDFHDCIVEEIKIEKDIVTIDFEFIYISNEHPLNPFKVAKTTDKCRLTFNKVEDSKAIIFLDDDKEKEVHLTDLDEMEFLEVKQHPVNEDYIYEMFGTDWKTNNFCSIKINAKSFKVEWNEFTETAWYV
ncbi:hypothetical protein [Gottfriedia acidiceleris]|uniref:Uncharacterized protein n=1 Tax=Gottfriedia acidiceleris TaxID=371036 RepID=A0ABY4JNN3_9BACI|nr:hypothetical protein [Gottfriedia acidiceleris]UPM55452.1 hypothetical protein MY490_06310 [Gottfriedia acidiceleris]